jgi:hypothetical protein
MDLDLDQNIDDVLFVLGSSGFRMMSSHKILGVTFHNTPILIPESHIYEIPGKQR